MKYPSFILLFLVVVPSQLRGVAADNNIDAHHDYHHALRSGPGDSKSIKTWKAGNTKHKDTKRNVNLTSDKMRSLMKVKSSKKMGSKKMGSMMKKYDVFRPMMTWKGKGSSTQRPTHPRSTLVAADLSAATAESPIVLFALASEGSRIVVDLTLPNEQQVNDLYLVRESNVQPGSLCPPTNGRPVQSSPGQDIVRVSLTTDTVVALCIDGFVVAQHYSIFETFDDLDGDKVRNLSFSLAPTCGLVPSNGLFLFNE